ncbi:MAG: bifunctional rhamnulose-1-phosphate aldolase/short-chain dehydrogenase [Acidobacteria bacterium]|nr:bifunctional rhamnulose-1-phosphate aldolase/short-chain dehydrogenase [Acidobacteriota bacterium]
MNYLTDLWQQNAARIPTTELDVLAFRSNMLGADLRITNFGGGNTSSKITLTDPFTGKPVEVLAVKGSGGDLGSIKPSGFALLYMEKLDFLRGVYRGEAFEDDMVAYYPQCAFGDNKVPASIDTPLHGFLPFKHVDHLHPDWAIALAASANGKARMEEFNARFGHKLVWLPWQRPGFELGLMLRQAVLDNPGCDGIILASHGLFTWGDTQRECYVSSLRMIDDMGQFIAGHAEGKPVFGGAKFETRADAAAVAVQAMPVLRGKLATARRSIGHFDGSAKALEFINSEWGAELAALGTSCPDHFIRTRISPLYVAWDPGRDSLEILPARLEAGLIAYREAYESYYEANKEPGSPALRDANPSVVLVPGVGMFTFGKNKKEARITAEFYLNAIGVMAGATALEGSGQSHGAPADGVLPHAKTAEAAPHFTALHNYVALPPREAFRIEYWALEEAKIQRMPKEQEFSRRIYVISGGGSGVGRAVASRLAAEGAHLMIADRNLEAAQETAAAVSIAGSAEFVDACAIELSSRSSIDAAIDATVMRFGGVDGIVNTAAVFPSPDPDGRLDDDKWGFVFDVNVTGNYILVDEAREIFRKQNLPAAVVLTSSANAVVSKRGSEAYDISKSAVNHLVRELAVGMGPLVRVNGIAPATVVEGSTMFPRDRVIASLTKYNIAFTEEEPTEDLRTKLARFYARRTLLDAAIRPGDCAEAILWLLSDRASRTTGHTIPVDGGLAEAFLR